MTDETIETKSVAEKPSVAPNKPEDVVNLSDRDIKWREKYKLTTAELESIKLQREKELKETTEKYTGELSKVSEQNKLLQETAINSKLEAEAVAAGLKDLDLVKLIDKSNVKIEGASIVGVTEAVAAFKARKPDYFGSEKKVSSSVNVQIPDAPVTTLKSAWDLTDAEWQLAQRGMF